MKMNLNRSYQNQEIGRHMPEPVAVRHIHPEAAAASSGFSLSNQHGFWELAFDGRAAILKQHPALFFVQWLLENPSTLPLDSAYFAAKVHGTFQDHPDFLRSLGWLCLEQTKSEVAKVLQKKQHALEAILDSEDELEPVKAETLLELAVIYEFQATYSANLSRNAEATADRMLNDLLSLYAGLITAVDTLGNPQPVVRAFGLHILFYVIMPSLRATGIARRPCFCCEHPQP